MFIVNPAARTCGAPRSVLHVRRYYFVTDITGRPDAFEMRQWHGRVFFSWRDSSLCEQVGSIGTQACKVSATSAFGCMTYHAVSWPLACRKFVLPCTKNANSFHMVADRRWPALLLTTCNALCLKLSELGIFVIAPARPDEHER